RHAADPSCPYGFRLYPRAGLANLPSRIYNQEAMSSADRPPNSFLRLLPKAELHPPLEGAIEPYTLLELRQRHGDRVTQSEVDSLYRYEDFSGFLLAFK